VVLRSDMSKVLSIQVRLAGGKLTLASRIFGKFIKLTSEGKAGGYPSPIEALSEAKFSQGKQDMSELDFGKVHVRRLRPTTLVSFDPPV
jgi:hypothetical protein